MKTIIFFSPNTSKYGAERSMCAVIKNLPKKDYRAIVFIPREGQISELFESYGIDYKVVTYGMCMGLNSNTKNRIKTIVLFPLNQLKAINKVYRLIVEMDLKVDLVYTNTLTTLIGVLMARKLRVPHILHIREFGKEDFNLHFHLGKMLTLFLFKQYTNKVIAISDAIENKYKPYFKDKIIRIYNGVPSSPELEHKFDSETFNMVMVGRISTEKRQIDVVKTFCEIVKSGIKNISLDLYGDGPDLNKINDYVKTNNLEQYILTKGYCSEINYGKYDTAIIASPYEGFGRVTVEYMMAGLPVIGANSGATSEIVSDNKTGLLFTPGNINSLKTQILKLHNNREYCLELGRAGRVKALRDYTEERYCLEVNDVINNVLKIN